MCTNNPQVQVPNFLDKAGPSLLIFSFSSGASPAHNAGGYVLPLCIYIQPTDIFTKEVDKQMISVHNLPAIEKRSFGCCAIKTHC